MSGTQKKNSLFIRFCRGYLTWIVWLGKGVAAWGVLLIFSWIMASANGRLIVVSPTPSLENKMFMVERVQSASYSNSSSFKGQVMVACLIDEQIELARQSNFSSESSTASGWLGCEKGAWIKRVAAVAGDTVEVANGLVKVNGAPISVVPKMERNGNVSDVYSTSSLNGVFELKANQVFLIGDHNLSFDSRYVGLFEMKQLKGRVTHAL